MKVFEAINEPTLEEYRNPENIKLFLAGGISNCPDWQSEVIKRLEVYDLDNLLVFNPRRSNFDINDKSATYRQIEWEFKYLNDMDIFTMYFANSEKSNQPICLYELGRHLERMKHRFPFSWEDRILVGIEDGYSREQDVLIQGQLATNYVSGIIKSHINTDTYAQYIYSMYLKIMKYRF